MSDSLRYDMFVNMINEGIFVYKNKYDLFYIEINIRHGVYIKVNNDVQISPLIY